MTPRIVGGELTATSYADVVATLTTLGSSYEGQVRLVNGTGLTIGRWAYVGGAIAPIGPVRFDRVTATPNGVASSVAGAVVTMTAGHSVATAAKTLRVWNTTDGTLIADEASGSWSVAGNDCTMSAATAAAVGVALGAGKVVRLWIEGVSELCIGGSTCYLRPGPGAWGVYTGAAQIVYTTTQGYATWGSVSPAYLPAADIVCTIVRGSEADGQYACAGVYSSASSHRTAGTQRAAGADSCYGTDGAIATPSAAVLESGGTYPHTSLHVRYFLSGGNQYNAIHAMPSGRRAYRTGGETPPVSWCAVVRSGGGEIVGLSCTRLSLC